MVSFYRQPDPATGKQMMRTLVDTLSHGVPTALAELVPLGQALKRRATNILAYFDRPDISHGPT